LMVSSTSLLSARYLLVIGSCQSLHHFWSTFPVVQEFCSGTNPGIVMSPNLPLFCVEVGLCPTTFVLRRHLWLTKMFVLTSAQLALCLQAVSKFLTNNKWKRIN